MNKRQFLQTLLASGALNMLAPRVLNAQGLPAGSLPMANDAAFPAEQDLQDGFRHSEAHVDLSALPDRQVDHYLDKVRNFNADFATDIFLDQQQLLVLHDTLERLERVQNYVGHGNYNLLGFDEMLFFARNYEAIGAFSQAELDFLDEIFHTDARLYGFFGEKVTPTLTNRISRDDVIKIPYSGHHLWLGESYNRYEQLRSDVGDQLLLTSGIRNIVKQIHLFLAKTVKSNYNLSRASRSLAPPGHSFHGLGDFDVGKIGLGDQNFTADFSRTEEFRRMITLGYIDIRYPDDNQFGVRYEPWHIKIA